MVEIPRGVEVSIVMRRRDDGVGVLRIYVREPLTGTQEEGELTGEPFELGVVNGLASRLIGVVLASARPLLQMHMERGRVAARLLEVLVPAVSGDRPGAEGAL